MPDRTILAVPGLAGTSPGFRAALWEMAAENGFDADAIATVMSSESGFDPSIRNPKGTATGLIQFTEQTARTLGTSTAELAQMSATDQLPYVAAFYRRMGITSAARPFDYYVVGLGQRPGLAMTQQVVSDKNYDVNSSLDVDHDGRITVADMAAVFDRVQAKAGGRRLDADPLSSTATPVSGTPAASALWSSLGSGSLLLTRSDVATLAVLRQGDRGPDVMFVQAILQALNSLGRLGMFVRVDGSFGPITAGAVRTFQRRHGLDDDGVVGPITWGALRDA
ncbi:MAG TPA: peptidoglycan-binding protein [Casimicrobiaceae bacterium]